MEKQNQLNKKKQTCATSRPGRARNIRRPTLVSSQELSSLKGLGGKTIRETSRDVSVMTSAIRNRDTCAGTAPAPPRRPPGAGQVIATYPAMMKFPRWHHQRHRHEDSEPKAERECSPPPPGWLCTDCTTMTCPSVTSVLGDGEDRTRPRGNIMTFCDRCTMTLSLNHAAVDTSDPAKSILKRCESAAGCEDEYEEAVRDVDDYPCDLLNQDLLNRKDRMKCKIRMALKCLSPSKTCANLDEDDKGRRVMFKKNAHCRTFSDASDIECVEASRCGAAICDCRGASAAGCQASEPYIPHSHRSRSRYHERCATDQLVYCTSPSRAPCDNYPRRNVRCTHCAHAIKWPGRCESRCARRPPSACDVQREECCGRGSSRARPCPYEVECGGCRARRCVSPPPGGGRTLSPHAPCCHHRPDPAAVTCCTTRRY